jgi:hypothetical protein
MKRQAIVDALTEVLLSLHRQIDGAAINEMALTMTAGEVVRSLVVWQSHRDAMQRHELCSPCRTRRRKERVFGGSIVSVRVGPC